MHWHQVQDEFVFVLEGKATVIFGDSEFELHPGDCMGFKAGTRIGHQVVNRTNENVRFLEIGDRSPGESGGFPNDDLAAKLDSGGSWVLTHKDGTPY